MFSAGKKLVVALAVSCAGAAGLATAAPAATGGWSTPEVLARYGVATDVAVAATGQMAVVASNEGNVLLATRTAHGDWGPSTVLVRSGHAEDAQAAYDDSGRLWVAWLDNDGSPRVLARHSRGGGGWSKAVVLARRARGGFTGLQLELAAPGRAVAGWRWGGLPRLGNGRLLLAEHLGAWIQTGHVDEVWAFDLALGDTGTAALMMARLGPGAVDETVTVSRRPAGGSWEPPVVLAFIPHNDRIIGLGTVAVDGTGVTTALWRDRTDAGVWQVRATRADGPGAWAAPVTLGRHAAPSLWAPPRAFSGPTGTTIAVWNRADYSLVASRYVSDAWSGPARVSGKHAVYWDAALDASGRAVAVWSPAGLIDDPGHGLRASLMSRRGEWGPRATVAARAARVRYPLAAMGHRDALAAWWHVGGETYQVRGSTHDQR